MTDVVRSVTVRVRGDISNLERAYDRAGGKSDQLADRLERVDSSTDQLSKTSRKLGQDLSSNNRTLETTKIKLDQAADGTKRIRVETETLGRSLGQGGNQIDKLSGRVELLAQGALALGPALIAGGTVPLAGLLAQGGATALGLGVLIGSFQGVKDAVKALDKAALEPSIANLQAEQQALDGLSPAARQMAQDIYRNAIPALKQLRDEGATNAFPGIEAGAKAASTRLPQVKALVGEVGAEIGKLTEDAGRSLSGKDWDKAFNYGLERTPGLLDDAGRSAGNLALAAANLWAALDPLTTDWSTGLLNFTEDLAKGSANLDSNKGFQEFLAYARKEGPEVLHTLGDVLQMLIQIGEAGAPISGPLIKALGELANLIGAVADSDLGTPLVAGALAMTAYGKATDLAARAQARFAGSSGLLASEGALARQSRSLRTLASDYQAVRRNKADPQMIFSVGRDGTAERISAVTRESERLKTSLRGVGKGTALVGGLAIAGSGAADKMGLANATSLALAGTLAGPVGTAVGGLIGGVMDLSAAMDRQKASEDDYASSLKNRTASQLEASLADLQAQKRAIENRSPSQNLVSTGAGYGTNAGQGTFSSEDRHKIDAINDELAQRNFEALGRAAASAAGSATLLGAGLAATSRGAQLAGMSAQQFDGELSQLNAHLAQRGSLTSYKSSLLDIADALKQNGRTLDLNTRKGVANEQALESLASSALERAQRLVDAGNQVGAIRFLKNAQGDLSAAAQAFGMPQRAADRFAKRMLSLDAIQANPSVNLDDGGSLAMIRAIQRAIDALHGKTVTITTKAVSAAGAVGSLPVPKAAGGRLTGPGVGPDSPLQTERLLVA